MTRPRAGGQGWGLGEQSETKALWGSSPCHACSPSESTQLPGGLEDGEPVRAGHTAPGSPSWHPTRPLTHKGSSMSADSSSPGPQTLSSPLTSSSASLEPPKSLGALSRGYPTPPPAPPQATPTTCLE